MDLQFPIGKFHRPTAPVDAATRAAYIDDIERMPAGFRAAVAGMTPAQLDTPYRPGGCPFQAWSLGELLRIHTLVEADAAEGAGARVLAGAAD